MLKVFHSLNVSNRVFMTFLGPQSGLIGTFFKFSQAKLKKKKIPSPKINTCFGFVGVFKSIEEKVGGKKRTVRSIITHVHFGWGDTHNTHNT